MMKSRIARLAPVLLLAVVGMYAVPSSAEVPTGLTQQGRILDAEGNAVNADVAITFTIYDDPEASEEANVLWTESQEITLEDGYFSTRLGDDTGNAFPDDLFDGSVRYIGVTVGSDDEMAPRERIGSVPYAFRANRADNATRADDVVGDIHPRSVSIGNRIVINAAGAWVGDAIDRPLTSLLETVSQGSPPGPAARSKSATAECGARRRVTGGGCLASSGAGTSVKANYPSSATDWSCTCDSQQGQTCDVIAYAVCASP